MEWLKEGIVAGLFSVLLAWYWHDKKQRDMRFVALETRMTRSESMTSKQQTQLEVMTVELRAFSDLTNQRLSHMQDSIDKITGWIDRQMEKPHG